MPGRLECGCRRRSARRRGHRPACPWYDQEKSNGHVRKVALRRKYETADPFPRHARGVIL